MRELRPFVVFGFDSTHTSLAAENVLREAGVSVKPMPLPRARGELCGIALRVPPQEEESAVAALAASGIRIAARDEIRDY